MLNALSGQPVITTTSTTTTTILAKSTNDNDRYFSLKPWCLNSAQAIAKRLEMYGVLLRQIGCEEGRFEVVTLKSYSVTDPL